MAGDLFFSFQVKHLKIQEVVIEASPEDVQAGIELEATISASSDRLSIDELIELVTFPIPGAGFAIAHIFKLGPTISYSVGVGASFSGEGVVDLGLRASLPDSAKVTADSQNGDGNSIVGFDGFSFEPNFDVKSLTARIDLDAYSEAKITLGIDVLETAKLDVTVKFDVPKVNASLIAAFGEPSPGRVFFAFIVNLSAKHKVVFLQTNREYALRTPDHPKPASNLTVTLPLGSVSS